MLTLILTLSAIEWSIEWTPAKNPFHSNSLYIRANTITLESLCLAQHQGRLDVHTIAKSGQLLSQNKPRKEPV